MPKTLDLIVPAYNEVGTIERALLSLKNQEFPSGFRCNVYVIVNGSTDSTYTIASNLAPKLNTENFTLVAKNLHEGGKPQALNCGLTLTSSDIVGYMDADAQLAKDTIALTVAELITHRQLQLVGALDIPLLDHLTKESLLYQFQKVQQLHREARKRIIPCGRYMCFNRKIIEQFPLGIHSEDTWLALVTAQKYGWESIRVMQEAHVYITPPDNWLDYIKQQARFECGFDQLIAKYPELEEIWNMRRKNTDKTLSKEQINLLVLEEMKKDGISADRLSQFSDIINEIFVETATTLTGKLVDKNGRWEPIQSTKKII